VKKSFGLLLTILLAVILMLPAATPYARSADESDDESDIMYANSTLGFYLKLPPSWAGLYCVIEEARSVSFNHVLSNETSEEPGLLFSVLRYDGALKEAPAGAGERYIAAQTDSFTYVLVCPANVQYSVKSAAEYKKMSGEIEAILQTVAVLPIPIPTSIIGGLEYSNSVLGFSLKLPASWSECYSVFEGVESASFDYVQSKETTAANGTLFSIVRINGLLTPEEAKEGLGERCLAAQTDAYAYVLCRPSDPGYAGAYAAEYLKMCGDIEAILKTVKAIPITGAAGIQVLVDGKRLAFEVPPQNVNSRVLVPLRAIFEEMGAMVEWDGQTRTVTAAKGETVVVLTIGDTSPTVNGVAVAIDQPGIIVEGRTLAPLRFVAEAFGGDVTWDDVYKTALILTAR
jgi:hypothetical protein